MIPCLRDQSVLLKGNATLWVSRSVSLSLCNMVSMQSCSMLQHFSWSNTQKMIWNQPIRTTSTNCLTIPSQFSLPSSAWWWAPCQLDSLNSLALMLEKQRPLPVTFSLLWTSNLRLTLWIGWQTLKRLDVILPLSRERLNSKMSGSAILLAKMIGYLKALTLRFYLMRL